MALVRSAIIRIRSIGIVSLCFKYNQMFIGIRQSYVFWLDFHRWLEATQSLTNHAGCLVADFLPYNLAGIVNAKDYNTTGAIEHTAQCFHSSVKLSCGFFKLNVNAFMAFC